MRLPDAMGLRQAGILLAAELRRQLSSRTFLALVLIASPLIGYSFVQAVALFAEASRAAIEHKELAPGMNPFAGVILPTAGAQYLITTLLFPFLAVRAIAIEKQSGSIKLLSQLRLGWLGTVWAKSKAMMVLWLLATAPLLVSIVAWRFLGGHVPIREFLNLYLGHLLYAFLVVGVSLLAASLADSASTAAIVVLAFTLGCWVLDFSMVGYGSGLSSILSEASPTLALKSFERGIFSLSAGLVQLLAAVALLVLSAISLHRGLSLRSRLRQCAVAFVIFGLAVGAASRVRLTKDVSEDHRNSFPAEDEVALREVSGPFRMTVYLAPDDPRLRDLEGRLFQKLRRLMPDFRVQLGVTGKTDYFGAGSSENYGLVVYEYSGKREESRSTSRSEVLETIHRMTGHRVEHPTAIEYPGYPLVADAERLALLFYALIPALFVGLFWASARVFQLKEA